MYKLIYILPAIAHTIGAFLLLTVKRKADENVKYWHLLVLSITEMVISYIHLLEIILSMTSYLQIYVIVYIVHHIGIVTLNGSTMFLILIDRFLEIYLPLRYKTFYAARETKITMVVFISVSVILTVTCALLLRTQKTIWDFLSLYYWPIFAISYLVVAIIVYGYIYTRYKKAKKDIIPHHQQANKKDAKKNTFLPTFLVLSFLCFWVVPVLIIFVVSRYNLKPPPILAVIVHLLMVIGLLTDAFAYVFSYRPVRNYLKRKKIIKSSSGLNTEIPFSRNNEDKTRNIKVEKAEDQLSTEL